MAEVCPAVEVLPAVLMNNANSKRRNVVCLKNQHIAYARRDPFGHNCIAS
jgi:hypothetical protein